MLLANYRSIVRFMQLRMLVIEIMIFVIGSQIQNLVKVGILVLVIGVLSFVIVRKSRMLVIHIFMFGIERF